MSEATVTVAKEYPDPCRAIYQFSTWATPPMQHLGYRISRRRRVLVAGLDGGQSDQSKRHRFPVGVKNPARPEGNAFMRGALAATPDETVGIRLHKQL